MDQTEPHCIDRNTATLQMTTRARSGSLAWHYTTGECLSGIYEDGQINLETGLVIDPKERRCVWFTTADTYEPTALKARVNNDGSLYNFQTPAEQAPFTNGLVRIGIPTARLFPYSQWRKRAHVHPLVAKGLEKIAVEAGSKPHTHWHFTCKPVPSWWWVAIEFSSDGEHWGSAEEIQALVNAQQEVAA